MELKLNREDLLKLYNVVSYIMSLMGTESFQENYKINSSYSYFLARNQKLLSPEIEVLRKFISIDPDPKFDEFEQKRLEIIKTFSEKDEHGNPKIKNINGQESYTIPTQTLLSCNQEIHKLEEEYKDVIEKRNSKIREVNEFVNSDELITVKVYKIRPSIEQDGIPPNLLKELFPLYGIED